MAPTPSSPHASPRYVTLPEPDWALDETELAAAPLQQRDARAVVINTPNNPLPRQGVQPCRTEWRSQWLPEVAGALAITDEIYEHITYDGASHIPLATIPGMEDRTITMIALSKTYSVTGWRVGWAIALPDLTDAIRRVHDFLNVKRVAHPAPGGRSGSGR